MNQAAAYKVLIVDDNADAANSLAALMQIAGYETRVAYDGKQGIEVAASFRPEVLLLDLGMPGMNGYDACRHLREQDWGHDIFVVALTAWGQPGDRQKSAAAGFDAHLAKPTDYKTIATLIADRHTGVRSSSSGS
ncbi:response regulator [Methylolobus aquaticus]